MKKIKILVDNVDSWMVPFAQEISEKLKNKGYDSEFISSYEKMNSGWCLFLLSCEKKLKELNKFDHNIVIHASDLPLGKGWSPLTWQILEGKNEIPISLFEANHNIDAGDIYLKDKLLLDGYELIGEIRKKLSSKIENLILEFLEMKVKEGVKQFGKQTFYSKRRNKDSELDITKSIKSQFNLLRVCDNENYPAFFYMGEHKYCLKIQKASKNDFR